MINNKHLFDNLKEIESIIEFEDIENFGSGLCVGATHATTKFNSINSTKKDVKKLRNPKETILDSSLITPTTLSNEVSNGYNVKIVNCGNYSQIYLYENKRIRKKEDITDLELKKIKTNCVDTSSSDVIENDKNQLCIENKKNIELENNIELKNIMRSKLQCQRLAKANIENWKTFITLTFDPKKDKTPMTNIDNANKRLDYFFRKIKRVKKDFKYICVPEFQKNGRVHYHLLCNIDFNDNNLIYLQEDNKRFRHIKYWNDGFTKVDNINQDVKKIIGYISKYMTKEIDNRLFGHRRYFNSTNLNKVSESYIDLDNERELDFYKKTIQEKALIYKSEYLNPIDNTIVTFLEFLKK